MGISEAPFKVPTGFMKVLHRGGFARPLYRRSFVHIEGAFQSLMHKVHPKRGNMINSTLMAQEFSQVDQNQSESLREDCFCKY